MPLIVQVYARLALQSIADSFNVLDDAHLRNIDAKSALSLNGLIVCAMFVVVLRFASTVLCVV